MSETHINDILIKHKKARGGVRPTATTQSPLPTEWGGGVVGPHTAVRSAQPMKRSPLGYLLTTESHLEGETAGD